jgi:hypothetical protein
MARQRLFGVPKTLLPPSDEHGRMDLRRTRGLGRAFARLDLTNPLPVERTRQATSLESQGCRLLSVDKEASLLVSVKGCRPLPMPYRRIPR